MERAWSQVQVVLSAQVSEAVDLGMQPKPSLNPRMGGGPCVLCNTCLKLDSVLSLAITGLTTVQH